MRKGDKVALIAPASPSKSAGEVARALQCIRDWGFDPVPFPTLQLQQDFLAGSDEERAADLTAAFHDPEIRASFSLRGGYGTARLLPLVDWKAAAETGKLFVGFSDLTSIHAALNLNGLQTLHAPTLATLTREDDPDLEGKAALGKYLNTGELRGFGGNGHPFDPITIHPGRATGRLIGGNLTVFAALCGTPWLPPPEGAILFLEDINEKPYRLDRSLTQLMNAGYLQKLSGILLGQFTDCTPGNEDRDDALTVLTRCLKPLEIPILAGIPSGHGKPSLPIMLGVNIDLDATIDSVSNSKISYLHNSDT